MTTSKHKTTPSACLPSIDPRCLAHSEAATQYARDVSKGTVPACKWTIAACQRHLDDLDRSQSESFPYRYDPEKGGRACVFIELLPHVDGTWDSEKIQLLPWQKFILCSIYGWVSKTSDLRRFTRAYVAVPRKNGKSTLAAGIALYATTADGEKGAQVYCAASTMRQAMYVFAPAKRMAEDSPELFKRLGLQVNAQSLVVPKSNSRFVALCSKPGDGGGASTFICDEYHEHDTNELFDAITRGMGARRQPLTFVITTAGSNIAGPCYEYESDIKRILDGSISRDRTFGIIYGIDDEDDWTSVDAAKKANPSWGVSVIEDTYLTELEEAVQNASKQNSFKTKRLNVWCNAAVAFFNMQKWNALADSSLHEEDFAGEDCIIGLDLASKLDLCATVKLFRREQEREEHFYLFCHSYLPDAQVGKAENAHYQKWSSDGYLTATPGDITDYEFIRKDIVADISSFNVREVAFDQHESALLTQLLEKETEAILTEIPQKVTHLSEPLKWMQALIEDGRLHHAGDPVLSWAVSNLIAKEDANENVFPRKAKYELKIDPVSATLNALSRARAVFGEPATAEWAFEPFLC